MAKLKTKKRNEVVGIVFWVCYKFDIDLLLYVVFWSVIYYFIIIISLRLTISCVSLVWFDAVVIFVVI